MATKYLAVDELLKQKAQLWDEHGVGIYAVGTGNILAMPAADVVSMDRYINAIKTIIMMSKVLDEFAPVKHGRWIPCSERLPEEDTDVLISYRYKQGEGDTSHSDIEITSYGTVYFGGRAIDGLKEWRAPFQYFHANYEVTAWMPLPEPYKEVSHER